MSDQQKTEKQPIKDETLDKVSGGFVIENPGAVPEPFPKSGIPHPGGVKPC
jgi:hypothetical protein